jgi:hypothetical protein
MKKKTDKKVEFETVAQIQKNAAHRTLSRSTNGKMQQRSNGRRAVKNAFFHAIGTIGADIDNIIRHPELSGRFSKLEIAAYCGTKLSKVNSHLNNELKKKFGLDYRVNENGKLIYEFTPESDGAAILKSVRKNRFK